jgi:hypothetical protein
MLLDAFTGTKHTESLMTDNEFLSLLNTIDFPRVYWELCDRFPLRPGRPPNPHWREAVSAAFREMGIVPRYNSSEQLFTCEDEQIGNYVWSAALWQQRHGGLELTFGGQSGRTHVGTSLAVMAYEARRLADPTFKRDQFTGTPPYPRPAHNADLAALRKIVKEFVSLVRLMKDAIRSCDS